MRGVARGFLIVVSILNGLAGLVCGVLFIAGPDGRLLQAGALLPVIQKLPLASVFFQDFVWIGVAMLLVLGLPNSVATVMLLRKSKNQYLATLIAGVLLVLWCGFELIFMIECPGGRLLHHRAHLSSELDSPAQTSAGECLTKASSRRRKVDCRSEGVGRCSCPTR